MTTRVVCDAMASSRRMRLDVTETPSYALVRAWLPDGYVTPEGLLHSKTVFQRHGPGGVDWGLVSSAIDALYRNKTACRRPTCLTCTIRLPY